MRLLSAAAIAAFALCAPLAAHAAPAAAPAPAKAVDKDRLYLGIWHAVARTVGSADKACLSPETRFTTNDDGVLIARESCRGGDADHGAEKVSEGPVSFPEAGAGAHFRITHRAIGLFPINHDYIVLDHDPEYSWFIAADPAFRELSIFARDPQMAQEAKEALAGRVHELGFDTAKLEFPPQPKL